VAAPSRCSGGVCSGVLDATVEQNKIAFTIADQAAA
jgi:hypothetical protein